jgi:ABC-type branched-subunit amino acid transport system substrate-binding protein
LDTLYGVNAETAILNASGGVLGRKIKVINLDDGSTPQGAISAAKSLAAQNVDLVVPDGAQASTQLPSLKNELVITVSPTVGPPLNTAKQFPLAYTLYPTNTQGDEPLLAYAKQTLHVTKVGLMVTNNTVGLAFEQNLAQLAPSHGIDVVSQQQISPTATDVTPQLQSLRSAGAQAVMAYPPGTTVGAVMTGMQDLGWKAPVVGPSALFNQNLTSVVPSSVANQLYIVVAATNARSSTGAYYAYNGIKSLYAQIDAKNETPNQGTTTAAGADSLRLAVWAWERAGKVNAQAAANELNGLRSVPKAQLPLLYSYPEGFNLDFTKTLHTPGNATIPTDYWVAVKVNKFLNGSYIGQRL